MGGALEVGYLYVALTPPSIAWRAAAVSRILREVQSSCMNFIFTILKHSDLNSHVPGKNIGPIVDLIPLTRPQEIPL